MTTDALNIQWKQVASFWVPGEPRPQPRPRARAMKIGGKWTARVYHPKDADAWRQLVEYYSVGRKPATPYDCPVRVDLELHCPRPNSAMRKKDPDGPILNYTKPDASNYVKAIEDAMQDAGWFVDDSRIVELHAFKLYHAKSKNPGALINVSVLDDSQQ